MSCMGRAEPSADRIPRLDLAHCLRDDAPHLLALAVTARRSDAICDCQPFTVADKAVGEEMHVSQ
jgi:hypothetical protein